jgi:predicted transcriptional regulator
MEDQKKSFMHEAIETLESTGFEVISFEGAPYDVVCDWAKVTIRRLSPKDLENAQRGSILRG